MQGLRIVRLVDKHLEINGESVFLNGVAWNEIDPVLGRAISEPERRRQMSLMKTAGVNCIRTAHYPFGPDFLRLCDEMGFYAIDEVPFGSRGRPLLEKPEYVDELICRTEATMRRDKNHASVIFWTFGNENPYTKNTKAVLEYAKKKDGSRPRGLPQIGSSQAKETMYHPERDVDFVSPHYLSPANMKEYEENTTKPLVQTEFAHACGNGFNDFEDRYRRMRERQDIWMGGCIWAWIDQSVMHPDNGKEFEKELSLTRTIYPNHQLPKDLRRDLPRNLQGNYIDALHFIDSWGDRATDGIVYGDGTPKDGYWLVKALYAGKLPEAKPGTAAPAPALFAFSTFEAKDANEFLLRIGRRVGMDQAIQTMGKSKAFRHDEYIVAPKLLDCSQKDGKTVYRLRWLIDGKEDEYIEGDVSVAIEPSGKVNLEYDLSPSEKCVQNDLFSELGLTLRDATIASTRVDWSGLGPLTSVPGKSKMNAVGTWAMHKDDYRFPGNRAEVKWVAVGVNSGRAVFVLESGTQNVSFDNIDGHICLTENMVVAGYGGKASDPSGLKSVGDITMKGGFRFYIARVPAGVVDVVPDLTYTYHYGF